MPEKKRCRNLLRLLRVWNTNRNAKGSSFIRKNGSIWNNICVLLLCVFLSFVTIY